MKRSLRRFLLILAALIIYLLVFPEPTHQELTVEALWAVAPLEMSVEDGGSEQGVIPFQAGSEYGYLTEEGSLLYRGTAAYQVALGRQQFVSYAKRPSSLVVQDTRGQFLHTIDTPGYPIATDEQILVIAPDGVTLSSVGTDGNRLWQRTLPSNLTALASRDGLTVAGVLGGSAHATDSQGRAFVVDAAAVDTSGVVQNVAVGPDGRSFATTSSAEFLFAAESVREMTLALYQVAEDRAVPVLRRQYLRNARSLPLVHLAEHEPLLIYTGQSELEASESATAQIIEETVIANVETGSEVRVTTVSPVISVTEQPNYGLYWLLSRSPQPDPTRGFRHANQLTSVTASGVRPMDLQMAADTADVELIQDMVIVRVDERVLAFRIEER